MGASRSGGTIAFPKNGSVKRTSTFKEPNKWLGFLLLFSPCSSSINEKSSRRLVLQLQLILPKKLTVLKAL